MDRARQYRAELALFLRGISLRAYKIKRLKTVCCFRVGAPFYHPDLSADIRLSLIYKVFIGIVCPALFCDVQQRTPRLGVFLGVR